VAAHRPAPGCAKRDECVVVDPRLPRTPGARPRRTPAWGGRTGTRAWVDEMAPEVEQQPAPPFVRGRRAHAQAIGANGGTPALEAWTRRRVTASDRRRLPSQPAGRSACPPSPAPVVEHGERDAGRPSPPRAALGPSAAVGRERLVDPRRPGPPRSRCAREGGRGSGWGSRPTTEVRARPRAPRAPRSCRGPRRAPGQGRPPRGARTLGIGGDHPRRPRGPGWRRSVERGIFEPAKPVADEGRRASGGTAAVSRHGEAREK